MYLLHKEIVCEDVESAAHNVYEAIVDVNINEVQDFVPALAAEIHRDPIELNNGVVVQRQPIAPAYASENPAHITRPRALGIVASMAIEAKNEFPLSKHSEANRLVVRAFIFKRMKELGMRPSHIHKCLDLAVSAAFVPDDTDVFAKQYESSKFVTQAHRKMDAAMVVPHWWNGYGLWAQSTRKGYLGA
jgi:hypothetical protein